MHALLKGRPAWLDRGVRCEAPVAAALPIRSLRPCESCAGLVPSAGGLADCHAHWRPFEEGLSSEAYTHACSRASQLWQVQAGEWQMVCGCLQGSAAQRQEAAQARAQAVDVLLRVGLAALAVSDYIRTVLCPQLQGHAPEPALLGVFKQVSLTPNAVANKLARVSQFHGHSSLSLFSSAYASQVSLVPAAAADVPCRGWTSGL